MKRFSQSLKTFPAYSQAYSEPHFKNFRIASRSLTASFLSSFEPLSKGFSKFLPKSCSLFSSLFSHFPKASQASFQKLHKPLSKDLQPLSRGFQAFFQRLPALLRASRSLFLAFSPYSLRRRGRFCGSGSGPRRSGRRRRVRSMLCCNCHSFILASWPESRMSGTFQPL